MNKEKTNKISVYLIKTGISPVKDVLKKKYKKISLNSESCFYYDSPQKHIPSWIEGFFNNNLKGIDLFTQSIKGVYFVKITIKSKERYFAIPFGFGYSMIEKNHCVDDFGLKTVLNLVDESSIRKIGRRTLSSEPKNTIEQLSKIGNFSDFGIDIEQDLVEEITGKPKDSYFGKNYVTGKLAFTASVQVNISNVEDFLKKSFEYYKKNDYKKNFAFIDQVKGIKDAKKWNKKLVNKLKDEQLQDVSVWMAIPEIIEWEDVDGFSYSGKKEKLVNDITIEYFKDSLTEDQKSKLDYGFLEKNKVYCFRSSSGEEYDNWSYFKCLYCEITEKNRKIILTNGKWYEIAKDFVEKVENNYNDTLKESKKFSTIKFIECEPEENENKYNESLAKHLPSGVLMDRKVIRYGGGASSVEFCDVYDLHNQVFIHVKNYYGSSALSHLFAQGRVSGELFRSDPQFRKKVREKESSLLFDPDREPNPSDYKIIFAIISKSEDDLNLPFFSKVNFKNERRLLNSFGFKNVYLKKIKRK